MIIHTAEPQLPERIARLEELAHNVWWSWTPQARELFRTLDYPRWRMSEHNPVKQLHTMTYDQLQAAAEDAAFLAMYDDVMASFDTGCPASNLCFIPTESMGFTAPIAYFSMEFAIHHSLPVYAGGLGVLAGDICKEASDLGLPMVGVGFMYPQGYFRQRITPEGWQEEEYIELDFRDAPISAALNPDGRRIQVSVQVEDKTVHVVAWQVRVGRVNLFLMDTDVEGTPPRFRKLSARLYAADPEVRIQQEIVLGIGGVRVLRALDLAPAIWHANEGHTSFMMLERVREKVQAGKSFRDAFQEVRESSIFTTHTPVPAGQHIFPNSLVEKYLNGYWDALGISKDEFLGLGRTGGQGDQSFNMSALAMRIADKRNAVSVLHEKASKRMWHGLWPDRPVEDVPIVHVTNGIHVPTWVAPEMNHIYTKYLGRDWVTRSDDQEMWDRVLNVPDEELWRVHLGLKRKLMHIIAERGQQDWSNGQTSAEHIVATGGLLDHDVLTIGFVRRFTEYKRPGLIFHDIERLKHIVRDRWRPVQIIFAGKSHPADFIGKRLIHEVYTLATNREFQARIAFIEDYDLHLAHYLAHGVDVWLNNPRRMQEASGTSGMKAALNGVPHLSVRDGWWYEGYNGRNGWDIGGLEEPGNTEEEDRGDAEALYRLLEQEVVPLYYHQDRSSIPHGWIQVMKESIRSVVPLFCSRRMMKQYSDRLYLPAIEAVKRRGPA